MANKELEDFVASIFPNEKKTKIKKMVKNFGGCVTDLVKTFLNDQLGFLDDKPKDQIKKGEHCAICKKSLNSSVCLKKASSEHAPICLNCAKEIAVQVSCAGENLLNMEDDAIKKFIPLDMVPAIFIDLMKQRLLKPAAAFVFLTCVSSEFSEVLRGEELELDKAYKLTKTVLCDEVRSRLTSLGQNFEVVKEGDAYYVNIKDILNFVDFSAKNNLASPDATKIIAETFKNLRQ